MSDESGLLDLDNDTLGLILSSLIERDHKLPPGPRTRLLHLTLRERSRLPRPASASTDPAFDPEGLDALEDVLCTSPAVALAALRATSCSLVAHRQCAVQALIFLCRHRTEAVRLIVKESSRHRRPFYGLHIHLTNPQTLPQLQPLYPVLTSLTLDCSHTWPAYCLSEFVRSCSPAPSLPVLHTVQLIGMEFVTMLPETILEDVATFMHVAAPAVESLEVRRKVPNSTMRLGDDDLPIFQRISSLTRLRLEGPRDVLGRGLTSLDTVQRLELVDYFCTSLLLHLAQLPSLSHLTLSQTQSVPYRFPLRLQSPSQPSLLPNLQSLSLIGEDIDPIFVSNFIAAAPNLTALTLEQTTMIAADHLDPLITLKHLKDVRIIECRRLAAFSRHMPFSDEFTTGALARLSTLTSVQLGSPHYNLLHCKQAGTCAAQWEAYQPPHDHWLRLPQHATRSLYPPPPDKLTGVRQPNQPAVHQIFRTRAMSAFCKVVGDNTGRFKTMLRRLDIRGVYGYHPSIPAYLLVNHPTLEELITDAGVFYKGDFTRTDIDVGFNPDENGEVESEEEQEEEDSEGGDVNVEAFTSEEDGSDSDDD